MGRSTEASAGARKAERDDSDQLFSETTGRDERKTHVSS
jgi:hypothetical protein